MPSNRRKLLTFFFLPSFLGSKIFITVKYFGIIYPPIIRTVRVDHRDRRLNNSGRVNNKAIHTISWNIGENMQTSKARLNSMDK